MVDTPRTRNDLAALFADNTSGQISPQDLRDLLASTAIVASGTSDPATAPATLREMFINTTNKKIFAAAGTASVADWVEISAAAAASSSASYPTAAGVSGSLIRAAAGLHSIGDIISCDYFDDELQRDSRGHWEIVSTGNAGTAGVVFNGGSAWGVTLYCDNYRARFVPESGGLIDLRKVGILCEASADGRNQEDKIETIRAGANAIGATLTFTGEIVIERTLDLQKVNIDAPFGVFRPWNSGLDRTGYSATGTPVGFVPFFDATNTDPAYLANFDVVEFDEGRFGGAVVKLARMLLLAGDDSNAVPYRQIVLVHGDGNWDHTRRGTCIGGTFDNNNSAFYYGEIWAAYTGCAATVARSQEKSQIKIAGLSTQYVAAGEPGASSDTCNISVYCHDHWNAWYEPNGSDTNYNVQIFSESRKDPWKVDTDLDDLPMIVVSNGKCTTIHDSILRASEGWAAKIWVGRTGSFPVDSVVFKNVTIFDTYGKVVELDRVRNAEGQIQLRDIDPITSESGRSGDARGDHAAVIYGQVATAAGLTISGFGLTTDAGADVGNVGGNWPHEADLGRLSIRMGNALSFNGDGSLRTGAASNRHDLSKASVRLRRCAGVYIDASGSEGNVTADAVVATSGSEAGAALGAGGGGNTVVVRNDFATWGFTKTIGAGSTVTVGHPALTAV